MIVRFAATTAIGLAIGMPLAAGCGRIGFDNNDVERDADVHDVRRGGGGADANTANIVLAAGWNHTCAAIEGEVRCWGSGLADQLGDGRTASSNIPVAVALPNSIQCWGLNDNGQLGNGSNTASLTPVTVPGW